MADDPDDRGTLTADSMRADLPPPTSPLDPASRQLKEQIDALVRSISEGDDLAYVHRWRQILRWAYNKTNDPEKKKKLKASLLEERGARCEGCGEERRGPELHMHRIDPELAYDRSKNFGYISKNVKLLCIMCHREREGLDA